PRVGAVAGGAAPGGRDRLLPVARAAGARAGGGAMIEAKAAAVQPPEAPAPPVAAPGERALLGRVRTPLWHVLAERTIIGLAFLAIAAIVLIFAFVVKEALPLFWEDEALEEIGGLSALFAPRQWLGYDEAVYVWQPVGATPKLNLVPLFVGTLKVTLLTMLISVPLGVGAAIYVSQYAPRWLREIVKPALELLAAIPSVVLGFFALMVLASWIKAVFAFDYRLNELV